MEIFISILLLIGGLVLILAGANYLTDGAAAVAKKWGVSDLVIGLTIVAFGTSAPELVVSLMSSFSGSPEIAIGNVVGSNIANVLVIVGVTAMVMPIKIPKSIMTNEIPLVILSALAIFFCANDMLFDSGSENVISRIDGVILLLFFAIFMRYTFSIAKNNNNEEGAVVKSISGFKSVLFILGGLAGLIFGGQFFVDGACEIARALGASESLIGLTLVAGGTSLPELATSVTAALKKNSGIAIGNVIGSNIFNIFLILGTSATVMPLKLGGINNLDLAVLVGSSLLFWFVGWFFKTRTITRLEGVIMFACYIAYTTVLISAS